jgi:acyl-coenzyme A thioesterase PaaI-like protein
MLQEAYWMEIETVMSYLANSVNPDGVRAQEIKEGRRFLRPSSPTSFQSTLEINVQFHRPVRPGRVVGRRRVIHRVGDLAYLEAELIDSDQATIATATASARVIPLDQARDAV